MCRCVSIIPGITMPPRASISSVPSGTSSGAPTASDGVAHDEDVGVFEHAGAVDGDQVPPRNTIGRSAAKSSARGGTGLVMESSSLSDVAGAVASAGPRVFGCALRRPFARSRRQPGRRGCSCPTCRGCRAGTSVAATMSSIVASSPPGVRARSRRSRRSSRPERAVADDAGVDRVHPNRRELQRHRAGESVDAAVDGRDGGRAGVGASFARPPKSTMPVSRDSTRRPISACTVSVYR